MDQDTTRILSSEERERFEGVTIDERTQRPEEGERTQRRSAGWETAAPGMRIRVFSWRTLSWKTKLLIGALAVSAIVVLVFFGGILLSIAAIAFGLWLLMALFRLLF